MRGMDWLCSQVFALRSPRGEGAKICLCEVRSAGARLKVPSVPIAIVVLLVFVLAIPSSASDEIFSRLLADLDAIAAQAQPTATTGLAWSMFLSARQNLLSEFRDQANRRPTESEHRRLVQDLEELLVSIQLLRTQVSTSRTLAPALDTAATDASSFLSSESFRGLELPRETPTTRQSNLWLHAFSRAANSFFPWPFVVVYVLLWLSFSKRADRIIRRLGKVQALGTTFEFSPEGAIELGKNVKDTFDGFRRYVDQTFVKLAAQHQIQQRVETLVTKYMAGYCSQTGGAPAGGRPLVDLGGFRCTLYVPDILFQRGLLYQLLNYYPVGGGRGRIFSTRYGIIGHAYRSGEDQYEANVREASKLSDLVVKWGMTREEAERVRSAAPCVGAAVLKDEGGVIAIFFFDVGQAGAFGENLANTFTKGLFDTIRAAAKQTGLSDELKRLNEDAAKYSPGMEIGD